MKSLTGQNKKPKKIPIFMGICVAHKKRLVMDGLLVKLFCKKIVESVALVYCICRAILFKIKNQKRFAFSWEFKYAIEKIDLAT